MTAPQVAPRTDTVRMMTGVLTDVYPDSLMVGVDLGAGTVVTVPRIGSYGPQVGDVVVVLGRSERMIVIGSVTTSNPIDGEAGASVPGTIGYVLRTGDTMTGRLHLPGLDPESDTEATTKAYVDRVGDEVHVGGGTLVDRAGFEIWIKTDESAEVTHSHSGYSVVGHTHPTYSPTTHNHDLAYAGLVHGHSGYAAFDHTHPGEVSVGPTGPTGPASTVAGPTGPTGPTGPAAAGVNIDGGDPTSVYTPVPDIDGGTP